MRASVDDIDRKNDTAKNLVWDLDYFGKNKCKHSRVQNSAFRHWEWQVGAEFQAPSDFQAFARWDERYTIAIGIILAPRIQHASCVFSSSSSVPPSRS